MATSKDRAKGKVTPPMNGLNETQITNEIDVNLLN